MKVLGNRIIIAGIATFFLVYLVACQVNEKDKTSKLINEINKEALNFDRLAEHSSSFNIFYEDWSADVYYSEVPFLIVARGEIWSYRFYFKNNEIVLIETFETEINERWRFYVKNEEPFYVEHTNTFTNETEEFELTDDVKFRFTQALFTYKDYIAPKINIDALGVNDSALDGSPWRWYANKYSLELLESEIFVDRLTKLIINANHLKSVTQFLEADFPIELKDDNILKIRGIGQITSSVGWYNTDVVVIIDLLDDAIHVAFYDEDGNAAHLYTETVPAVSNAAEHLYEWTHRAEYLESVADSISN
jgi:hypothetical protein